MEEERFALNLKLFVKLSLKLVYHHFVKRRLEITGNFF